MESFDLLCDNSTPPELLIIDHQETVNTEEDVYDNVLPNSTPSSFDSPADCSFSGCAIQSPFWDTSHLFSFELETNGLPKNLPLPESEVNWIDILGASNESVDLEDIDLDSFPTSSETLCSTSVDSDPPVPVVSIHCMSPCWSSPPLSPSASVNNTSAVPQSCFNHSRGVNSSSNVRVKSVKSPGRLNCHDSRSISRRDSNLHNEDLSRGKPGQPLLLSSEERQMLHAMGAPIPTRLPLNRIEEKALRMVRRKIRNKLSAQSSRLKRQEYVVDLEHRMTMSNVENRKLRDRIVSLETENKSLFNHLRKLRSYLSNVLSRKDKQPPLPLFIKSTSTAEQSKIKKMTKFNTAQTATAAAGGTSLLILTFMILAWTAVVPIPPSLNFSKKISLGLLVTRPNAGAPILPGQSRMLLENHDPDPDPLPVQSGNIKLSAAATNSLENRSLSSKAGFDEIIPDGEVRSKQTPIITPLKEDSYPHQTPSPAIVVGVVSNHHR